VSGTAAALAAPRLAVVLGLVLAVAACQAAPVPSSSPSLSATLTPRATPSPAASAASVEATRSPVPASAPPAASVAPSSAPPAPGSELVDIPEAGIRLPVPSAWEWVDGAALADPEVKEGVIARYPGMTGLMAAADSMGDRGTPALVALDPAAKGISGSPGPSISVLVAQPAVSGPLLDFVAGFIADGFAETFGSPDPVRSRLDTPVGEAVRLQFDIPVADGAPMMATAYVLGASEGTLLITVMGPPGEGPAADPDAVVLGAAPLP
jgi:hypothetical protein